MITYRKACLNDINKIHEIIIFYSNRGLLLPRLTKDIEDELDSFLIAEDNLEIIGVSSLYIFDQDLCEIRSLAIVPERQGNGIGKQLVLEIIKEAQEKGLNKLLSLTYETLFFKSIGFYETKKEFIPQKVWKDCIHCSKLNNCDENAMIYNLRKL